MSDSTRALTAEASRFVKFKPAGPRLMSTGPMSVDERREWLKQLREWKKQLCAGVNPPSEIRQELFNFGSCYDDWYLENRVDDDGDDLGGDVIPSKNQHEGDPSGRSRDENQGD